MGFHNIELNNSIVHWEANNNETKSVVWLKSHSVKGALSNVTRFLGQTFFCHIQQTSPHYPLAACPLNTLSKNAIFADTPSSTNGNKNKLG